VAVLGIEVDLSQRKKACCKAFLCENFQRQSCNVYTAFSSLSNRALMVGEGRFFLPEIFRQNTLQETAASNRYNDIRS